VACTRTKQESMFCPRKKEFRELLLSNGRQNPYQTRVWSNRPLASTPDAPWRIDSRVVQIKDSKMLYQPTAPPSTDEGIWYSTRGGIAAPYLNCVGQTLGSDVTVSLTKRRSDRRQQRKARDDGQRTSEFSWSSPTTPISTQSELVISTDH